jgi:DNA helicase HerA-like ATPase
MTRDFPIDDAGVVRCDLDVLVDTRMLIQANSGGGKSYTVRRVLEQTHGRVQQLVIDPEGEFASLRERFDYVHAAASGGDTAAHPRSAALLAERLLELNASAILDLYELSRPDRVRFVRLFLEALIEAPKRLWHPVIVVVDEAHTFCPESEKAESANAVIELASRGRKRGYCAVLATQRIQKLNKDAAADLNNKLIGRRSTTSCVGRPSRERMGHRYLGNDRRRRDRRGAARARRDPRRVPVALVSRRGYLPRSGRARVVRVRAAGRCVCPYTLERAPRRVSVVFREGRRGLPRADGRNHRDACRPTQGRAARQA